MSKKQHQIYIPKNAFPKRQKTKLENVTDIGYALRKEHYKIVSGSWKDLYGFIVEHCTKNGIHNFHFTSDMQKFDIDRIAVIVMSGQDEGDGIPDRQCRIQIGVFFKGIFKYHDILSTTLIGFVGRLEKAEACIKSAAFECRIKDFIFAALDKYFIPEYPNI